MNSALSARKNQLDCERTALDVAKRAFEKDRRLEQEKVQRNRKARDEQLEELKREVREGQAALEAARASEAKHAAEAAEAARRVAEVSTGGATVRRAEEDADRREQQRREEIAEREDQSSSKRPRYSLESGQSEEPDATERDANRPVKRRRYVAPADPPPKTQPPRLRRK